MGMAWSADKSVIMGPNAKERENLKIHREEK